MRKVVYSLIGLMLFAGTTLARPALSDVKQGDVQVTLSVPQIVSLVIVTPAVVVVPGPEDYNRLVGTTGAHITLHGCLSGADIGATFTGRGFADRAEAIRIIIFSNAQRGADVYVHGNTPTGPAGEPLLNVLRLEDTFLTVMTEKTWVLLNKQEGANAKGPGTCGCEEFDPNCTHTLPSYRTDPVTGRAYFLQMVHEAQKIFGVKQSTKAPRDVVFKLGIGNLDRYTEGNYNNTLVFTLMPRV